MQIKDVKFYILEGEPVRRQVHARGGIEKVSPGLNGLFTHVPSSLGSAPMFEKIKAISQSQEEPLRPTYTAMLRLVTDGNLDAYTNFASGFHHDELEWQA